jgi:hypothetical protein
MFGLYCRQVTLAPEIQFMNAVTHVDLLKLPLHLPLHVLVHVGVTTDVEVAWHLLHSKRPDESAAVTLLEGSAHQLQLFEWIVLAQELKGTAVNIVAVLIEPPLFHRADVGVVRDHDVLQVKRDDFAGVTRELYVEVDAASQGRYFISSRVTSFYRLISAL